MFKFFTSDLRRNLIKILCLSIGLSIGLLLIARVYFDKSYDSFFKDSDNIYKLYETMEKDGEFIRHPSVSGGWAPLFEKQIPQVELSTRYVEVNRGLSFILEDGRKLKMESMCLADDNLFAFFNIPVTGGDAKSILSTAGQCLVPRSRALKIGGDVIGTTFTIYETGDKKYMIGGIYDDLPLNSSIPNGFYFGFVSDPEMTKWRDGFGGNDIYKGYIKLVEGAKVQDISAGIEKIVDEKIDRESDPLHLNIIADRLTSFHSTQKDIRTMDWMLLLLAVILLLGSSLNFLLIVIGQIGKRSKEMAIRKCYGTSDGRIFCRVMGESLSYLVLSVVVGVLFVSCFPALCSRLLGYTPFQLFTTGNVWFVILGVCILLLLFTGVIPAWIYCRTPVASAFRGNFRSRRGWKMSLLAIQFFASGVLMCLLVLVVRQYRMMMNMDKGYDDENVAWVYLSGSNVSERDAFVSELRSLSFVKQVSTADTRIGDNTAGNMVWMNGDRENSGHISDNYRVNSDFFDMIGMEFIQGETFNPQSDSTINQVIVEKSFINVIKKLTGKDEEYVVGKSFRITEHGLRDYTICGVVNDIRRGNMLDVSEAAGVWFPCSRSLRNVYVKLDETTHDKMEILQDTLDKFFPDSDIHITTLKSVNDAKKDPIRNFATSVMIAGIAILVIALIGLIGYTGDEIQRRSKEIAIRKVTGASSEKILLLFLRNIVIVAFPSLVGGGCMAIIIGRRWLSQFSDQVSLSPFSMLLCVMVLLLMIIGVAAFNTIGVAGSNPINHLRNE